MVPPWRRSPRRGRVVVVGGGRLADDVAAAFGRGGRPVRRVRGRGEVVPAQLRAASTVILTPGPGLEEALAALRAAGRAAAGPPPRALLVSAAGDPLPASIGPAGGASAAEQPPLGGRLERVVLEQTAARLLLARRPLHLGLDPLFGQQVHLVIAGHTALADALLLQALRVAHYSADAPRVTLLSDDAERWRARFLAAHPHAESFSRLCFLTLDGARFDAQPPVSAVIVTVPDPVSGLETADTLSERVRVGQRVSPPVLLEVGDRQPAGVPADWDGQLYPFSTRGMVLAPEVLLEGQGDELARVVHEHYRDTRAAQGGDPDAAPSSRPWAELAESYRQANRHQADHLWAKLAVTDCRAVREERVESFAFAPTEVERLAVIEHGRWAADRFLDGWTYAPKRDNAAKHHPQLIPYRQLSGPMKDLDRFAVRLVPALLARSGLGVARMLIVGVSDALPAGPAGTLRRLVDRMLRRLLARYPDRGLVIAATLTDAGSRLIAGRALESADAVLFLLCPRPVSETLALQPDERGRRSVLQLAARAERRIPLPQPGDLRRWLEARAEILVHAEPAGSGAGPDVVHRPAAATDGPPAVPLKRVRIDPSTGLEWSFEY